MLGKLVLAVVLQATLMGQALAVDCKSDRLVQSEMNDCAERDFATADTALNARYKNIVGCLGEAARPLVKRSARGFSFATPSADFRPRRPVEARSNP